jgi:hypothetical protein
MEAVIIRVPSIVSAACLHIFFGQVYANGKTAPVQIGLSIPQGQLKNFLAGGLSCYHDLETCW